MSNRTLELYSPHQAQLAFHNSQARYRVASWGRQAGKSTACLNELLARAWNNPGTKSWYVSPTYEQAKNQYRRMIGMLSPCWGALIKKNQTELRAKMINGSEIVFKSGEVSHNLRGDTLHGVIVDEVRDQAPELWSQILSPMIRTTQGWAAFVSTPAGFDAFYDLFQRGEKDSDWEVFHAPSTCNPLFTTAELESAKKEMSEAEFAQEILAEFRDLTSGKAYLNHGTHNHRVAPLNQYLPIVVAMDFNLNPMSWALGQARGEEFYFFSEISLKNSHTQEASKELIARVSTHSPGLIITGDATAKAGQRAAHGRSDYSILFEMLDQAKIKYVNEVPDSNPHVKDRVNVVNAKLKAADGSVKLFYDPIKCPMLKRDFERVVWKNENTLDQVKDTTLTHMSDAVGYAVCGLSQMWKSKPGVMRVITR